MDDYLHFDLSYDLRFGTKIRDYFVSSSDLESWLESFGASIMQAVVQVEIDYPMVRSQPLSLNVVSSSDGEEAVVEDVPSALIGDEDTQDVEPDSTSADADPLMTDGHSLEPSERVIE
jgi:hypothetical protein